MTEKISFYAHSLSNRPNSEWELLFFPSDEKWYFLLNHVALNLSNSSEADDLFKKRTIREPKNDSFGWTNYFFVQMSRSKENDSVMDCHPLKISAENTSAITVSAFPDSISKASNLIRITKDTSLKQLPLLLKYSSNLAKLSQIVSETCAQEQFATLVGKLKTLRFARDRTENSAILVICRKNSLTSFCSMIVSGMSNFLAHTYAEGGNYNSDEHILMNWDFDPDYQIATLQMAKDERMDNGIILTTAILNSDGLIYALEWCNSEEGRILLKASVSAQEVAA